MKLSKQYLKSLLVIALFFTISNTFSQAPPCPIGGDRCASIFFTTNISGSTVNFYFPYSVGDTYYSYDATGVLITSNVCAIDWHFGDPSNTVLSTPNPTFTYPTPSMCNSDMYIATVCLTLGDIYCKPIGLETCGSQQTIIINNPNVSSVASIVANPIGNCGEYTFSYTSANSITNPQWSFSDGSPNVSGVNQVTHTFPSNGSFIVTLLADQITPPCMVATAVTITDYPEANFGFDVGDPCDLTVDFIVPGFDPNNYYRWNFNDGNGIQTYITPSFPVTFSQPGEYTVFLEVESPNGCKKTVSMLVTVGAIPATFTTQDFCVGEFLQVAGVIGGGVSYDWTLTGPVSATFTGTPPSYPFSQPGTYQLELEVISPGACSATSTQTINVLAVPNASFTAGATTNGCGEVEITLTNSGTFTDYEIAYNYPGSIVTGTASGNNFSGTDNFYSYPANGIYHIGVTLNNGICTNSSNFNVNVTNMLTVAITPSSPYYLCPNSSLTLGSVVNGAISGSGSLTYEWVETGAPTTVLGTNSQFNVTAAGFYKLIVTYNGCSVESETVEIQNLADPVIPPANVLVTSTVSCLGAQDGAVEITIPAALFTNGCLIDGVLATTNPYTISNLAVVNYITIANDKDPSCNSILTINIPNDGPVITGITVTPSNCSTNTGSATVTPSGAGLSYTWYQVANYPTVYTTGANPTGILAPGDYTLEVSDGSCVITQTVNIPSSTFSLALLNTSLEVCMPGGTIDIEIDDFGIGVTLDWKWHNGTGWQTITPGSGTGTPQSGTSQLYNVVNGVGNYEVIGTFNGCTYTLPFTLTPTNIQVVLTKQGGLCTGDDALVTSQVVGGDGNYTTSPASSQWSWLPSITGSGATVTSATPNANTYNLQGLTGSIDVTLDVIDEHGCSGTQTLTVTPYPPIYMAACGLSTPVTPYNTFQLIDLDVQYDGNGDIDLSATQTTSPDVDFYPITLSGCDVELCATNDLINVAATSTNYSFEWYLPNQEVSTNVYYNFTIPISEPPSTPAILKYEDPLIPPSPSPVYIPIDVSYYYSSGTLINVPSGVITDFLNTTFNPNADPIAFTDNSSGIIYPYFVYDGTDVYFDLNSSNIPYTVTVQVPTTQSILIHAHTGIAQSAYFLPGFNIYEVYVSDENGCRKGPYAITLDITPPTDFPAFDFVWADHTNDVEEAEEPVVDVDLKDNMQEAANSLITAASECMQQQGEEMAVESGKCFDISTFRDEFTLSYDLDEYHYTLYYYDRAGQLTKTVPPAGIDLLDETEIGEMKAYRTYGTTPPAGITSNVHNLAHQMETQYQYNGLGQLIKQETPDGGITNFIYDGLNRLRFSQNAEQASIVDGKIPTYSYTKYDELGRIIEVGESTLTGTFVALDAPAFTDDPITVGNVVTTYPGAGTEITVTVYSTPYAAVSYYGIPQHYLQNRVSYVYNDKDGDVVNTTTDQNHTYYSYDAHGNVEWLVQEVAGLGQNFVKYEYDLISGNVLKVKYNEQREDRFYHRYKYDTENRLQVVETSRDGLLWDKDANYNYYQHGPLQRAVLGEDHVQGLDYLYTIHGWLKSINNPGLSRNDDGATDNSGTATNTGMPSLGFDKDGLDATVLGGLTNVAQDRFGMSLGYYNGDYSNTNTFHNNSQLNGSALYAANGAAGNDLYNGNITHWTHSQLEFDAGGTNKVEKIVSRASTYQYDVLNRIKASSNQQQTAIGSSGWIAANSANHDYETGYTYDANGNLQLLDRFNEGGTTMDNLTYTYYEKDASGDYYSPGSGYEKTNRLYSVDDAFGSAVGVTDVGELVGLHEYSYDEIGNLVLEEAKEWMNLDNAGNEELYDVNTSITWTVYGKVASVHKETAKTSTGGIYQISNIQFAYDASGNRIRKTVSKKDDLAGSLVTGKQTYAPYEIEITYYVRDAQGNTLAVYEDNQADNVSNHELNMIEQPIYGSDRLGQNTAKVLLAFADPDDPILPLGTGVENISEYQNWVLSANGKLNSGLDDVCNTKIDIINIDDNNNYTSGTNNEFLGIAKNGVAVAENTEGELQFYTVLTKNYLGNADACLVYDAEGKLMKGTELITDINTESKPVIVNLTGTKQYALITLNSSNQPEYHIIDMNAVGYGPLPISGLPNAGEVQTAQVGNPLTTNTTASYGLHFTGFEDHVNEKTIVYTTRFTPLIPQGGEGTTEIVAYEFTGVGTPQEHILYNLNSCDDTKQGELQISKDGTKILWYHHNEYVTGFDHRVADIYEIELDASKLAITGNVQMISTSDAGNYGNGNVEGGANASDIFYGQRGIYKEAKTQDVAQKTEKHIWKYSPLSALTLSNITPLSSYLFSEIKRGPDSILYMPNMGEQATQIQNWDTDPLNATPNGTATLTAGAAYQLTGSMPTQVFKMFATSGADLFTSRIVGDKQYELKDHLGNVRVVISDRKFLADENSNDIIDAGDYFYPEVNSFSDYYPFGSNMRRYQSASYRYGFNGKEQDNDMGNADGAVYDYGFRIYDSRIGKFLSVDPLFRAYPFYSPYQFAANMPIWAIDLDGLEAVIRNGYIIITTPSMDVNQFLNDRGASQWGHNLYQPKHTTNENDFGDIVRVEWWKDENSWAGGSKGVWFWREVEYMSHIKPKEVKDFGLVDSKPTLAKINISRIPPLDIPHQNVKIEDIEFEDTQSGNEEINETGPNTTELDLNIPFHPYKFNFKGDPTKALQPIVDALLEDGRNRVSLSPNTMESKGAEFNMLTRLIGDADNSKDLVKGRAITIVKYLLDKGVSKDQIHIDGSDVYEKGINVTGTLTKY